jgi:alkyl sulfatase BDS1-like metallo-beta-lactamase superfamily hydrolase
VVDDILVRYGNRADVVFASHHCPTWGKENVRNHLRRHRDMYRYIHDQTLRRANAGATLHEVAALIAEPDAARVDPSVRGYYGTLNHNVKAVYQYYFGWWDGVPANFNPLPPVERAERFVAAMGGVQPTLQKGIEAFRAGDYRWSADVLNNLVFSDPGNREARDWLAASYEQIGFQAESGAWRDYYLSAAMELRDGKPRVPPMSPGDDVIAAVPTLALFDVLAARYTPGLAEQAPFTLQFTFTDVAEDVTVEVGPDAAFPRAGVPQAAPDAVFRTTRAAFNQLVLGKASAKMMALEGDLEIEGDRKAISSFFDALEPPKPDFEVVLP